LSNTKSKEQLIKDFKEELNKKFHTIDQFETEFKELKEANKALSDQKQKIENVSRDVANKYDELQERLDDMEAKKSFSGKAGGSERFGDNVLKSYKKSDAQNILRRNGGGRWQSDQFGNSVKEITRATGSGEALVDEDYREEIIDAPLQQTRVIGSLPVLSTNSNLVEYVRLVDNTGGNAGPQVGSGGAVENVLKNESDYDFELDTAKVQTIAHFTKASQQILDDAQRLQSFVDTKMSRELEVEIEDQLIKGTGSSGDLDGYYPNATAYDNSLESGVTNVQNLDVLRLAMFQVRNDNFLPNAIMLDLYGWTDITLTKDNEGRYLFGNPMTQSDPRLWGLPVVPTQSLGVGEFIVSDTNAFSTVYDRMQASVALSTEDGDNFRKNMVTVRAEARLAHAIERELAARKGTLNDVIGS
jgi:HK97 family phage major capsid protein